MMEATLAAVGDLLRRDIHGVTAGWARPRSTWRTSAWRCFGAFFEYELAPWDFAAGASSSRRPGGKVTTGRGDPLPIGQDERPGQQRADPRGTSSDIVAAPSPARSPLKPRASGAWAIGPFLSPVPAMHQRHQGEGRAVLLVVVVERIVPPRAVALLVREQDPGQVVLVERADPAWAGASAQRVA